MPSLKGLLFTQYAAEGLNQLVEEMQKKYKPKKGRRFNHNNITYEISRPSLKESQIEFEISSKIPEDELQSTDAMKRYFEEIKKILSQGKGKPSSIKMENIVWDSRKETEKQREYVKLVYQYSLDELFNNSEIVKVVDKGKIKENVEDLPATPSTFTQQGKLVLKMVRDTIQAIGRERIDHLVNANKEVQAQMAH